MKKTIGMFIRDPNRILLAVFMCAALAFAAESGPGPACVKIDSSRDNLSEQDRQAARLLLTQALEKNGVPVVVSGCGQEYSVYHVKMGNTVVVTVTGPQGSRQATVRGIDDLPNWYDQMVRSLCTGAPLYATSSAVTRTNAASSQMAQNRVEADRLWYVRMGYGSTFGGEVRDGPAFGFGYRYELDNLAVDFSFLDFMLNVNRDDSTHGDIGLTATWIRIQGLYFLNPLANGSFYVGAGLGWGAAAAAKEVTSSGATSSAFVWYSGGGLEGQLTGGYEFLRASTIRMFLQADLTLPFYMAKRGTIDSQLMKSSVESIYLTTVSLCLGIGLGKSTARVRVIQ